MSRISNASVELIAAVADLLRQAEEVRPAALPKEDEVLSGRRIAQLFLDMIAGCGLGELALDDHIWSEHLWDLQRVLAANYRSCEARLDAVIQWVQETATHYYLDLCGFEFVYHSMTYDDLEWVFNEPGNAYPLMGIALSNGSSLLADEEPDLKKDFVLPSHVLCAALMQHCGDSQVPDAELPARICEFPLLALLAMFFHILPEENPFCGEMDNEQRGAYRVAWHEVPALAAAEAEYRRIVAASPDAEQLASPGYMFAAILQAFELS